MKVRNIKLPYYATIMYIHIVFTTKTGFPFIHEVVRPELQSYIIGTLSNLNIFTYEIYSNPDHIHILCTLPRTLTMANLISKIKTSSSKWIKTKGIHDFDWQDGYGIFSVSSSKEPQWKIIFVNSPNTINWPITKMSYVNFSKNMKLIMMNGIFGIKIDQ